MAWLYSEHGNDIDRALGLAQTALERLPENPYVLDTLGWIYYKKGFYSKAIALLEQRSEKLSDNATVKYHLGMAYYKNGNTTFARRELQRALELDPTLIEANQAKETLDSLRKG